MQQISMSLGAYFIALCLALSSVSVSADERYSAQRTIALDTTRSKIATVANTIFNLSLPADSDDSTLYSALATAYGEQQSEEGLVLFQNALMEITEQFFKACNGTEEQRPEIDDVGFHIQQFVTILATSPLDVSALRKQFGILICLHELVTEPKPDCATVDCSGGLGNTTTTAEFFCCLQDSDVQELLAIESVTMSLAAVPCLAFVVDTTGSMAGEIAAVQALINGFINPADPVCYILVDFNDFGTAANSVFLRAVFDPTGALPSGTLAQFMAAVNALTANGGGDCPEFGMSGLLLALDQISGLPALEASLSQIILVTDASASDNPLFVDVIAQATTLDVIIHALLIRGGCSGSFGNYPDIVVATGGIQVNNLADFDVITIFVQSSLVSGGFGGDAMFGPEASSFIVTVSKFATVLQVLVRTDQSQVMVTRPNGTTIDLAVAGSLVFFEDEDPLHGDWTFSVASGTLAIAVNAPILLDFFVSHIIDDPDSDGVLPVCEPPACSVGRVAVSTSRLSDFNLTCPVYLAIVNSTGGVIDEVRLQLCGDVLISDDSLAFPPEAFYYQLRGCDCLGNVFVFTSQFAFEFGAANTTVLDDHIGLILISGTTTTISTRLQHSAVGNTLFISAMGSNGLMLESPTNDSEVTVPAGEIFTVAVVVSVSSDLAPGSTVFLYLIVEDPCSNITVTFHWSIRIEDDPCDPDPCDPNAVCDVSPGTDPGFTCTCIAPFVGDGFQCQQVMMGDDPHFSVALPSGKLLCYTVQGEHSFSFNLISSDQLYMNAMFVPDSRREEVTWLGSMGIVVTSNGYKESNSTSLRFVAKEKKIYYGDKVVLSARNIEKLTFSNGKLTISEAPPVDGFKYPSVHVDLQDVALSFTIKFMNEHLDLFWHSTGKEITAPHGLIGQFFRKDVVIDEVRKILILPGKEPVPVMRRPVWSFMEREMKDDQLCWTAMNPGYQGEGLIDGTYFDYLVNDVLSTEFKFKHQQ